MVRRGCFYDIKIHRAQFNAKNIRLTRVKSNIYFCIFTFCFWTSLNEIRLAIEAISVPKPPRFTPIRSAFALSVKAESNIAAGTLESIWLESTPTATSLPFTTFCKKALT